MSIQKKLRRERVVKRLQAQLNNGNKRVKLDLVPLTSKDVKRINKEIEILEDRIKNN